MSEKLITFEEAAGNLLACATLLAENIKSSDGHAEAMKEIVPRYLAKNQVDFAAELANQIDDPFTRDQLLTITAEKCAAIDDDEYAFQLIEAIEDYGSQLQARENVVLQKSAKGDYAKAFEIADQLDHADYAYADIAVRQFESGDETGAMQTLEKIEYPNAKIAALQTIALAELKKEHLERALQMLGEASNAAENVELTEEKVRAFVEIGNHFVEAKQNRLAVETFDKAKAVAEMLDNVHRDALLRGVALGLLDAGSLELADRALDLVEDKTQMAWTLAGFSARFRQNGEAEESLETLEEAYAILKSQRDAEVRNSRERYNVWQTIAVEFARLEKPERAIETAQEIVDEAAQTNALAQIAQICASQNNENYAHQAIKSIGDDSQKMFALIGTSDAEHRAGNSEAALNLLREAETLSETVPQIASRSVALNEFAKRFFDLGDREKARELLHENLETITQIRDESSLAVALAQLNDYYETLGFELNDTERETLAVLARKAGA